MADTVRLTLKAARKLGNVICRELAPYCQPGHVALAGSARRGVSPCNDIDIVCIPTDPTGLHNRIMQAAQDKLCCGEKVARYILKTGVQLDVYFADSGKKDLFASRPSNWGSVLLCRTGSKQHNIMLCQAAAKQGLKWIPNAGLYEEQGSGKWIAGASEKEIFKAMNLAWKDPEDRSL